MENKDFYNLGKRDAVAEVLMMYRMSGEKAIKELAEQLLKVDPENPHALALSK